MWYKYSSESTRVTNQRNHTLQALPSKVKENNPFALNIADFIFPMAKDGFFQ